MRGTVIHDPGDPLPAAPSALLLLVGADVADPRSGTVLRRAAAEGYAGVVVKCRGQEADRLTAEAERCSLAVLAMRRRGAVAVRGRGDRLRARGVRSG